LKVWAKRIFIGIVLIYQSLVVIVGVTQWVWRSDAVGIGVLKAIFYLLLWPAFLLLPITLLLRRKWLALSMIPNILILVWTYGAFLTPRTQIASAGARTLRVMTFNLETPDEKAQAEALAEIIRAADADVVALQELSVTGAKVFAEQLREQFPHQALHGDLDFSGQGVLSRFPISENDYWRYSELPGALGHQRVVLQIEEQPVVLYNVHPVPPVTYAEYLNATPHRKAIEDLLNAIGEETLPVLAAGDFNMTQHFFGYRQITERFTDAFRAVGEIGLGFTFPNKSDVPLPPLVRLDYIFYETPFRGVRAYVWPQTGPSDHAPVVAELAWPQDVGRVEP
jgi:endonuclease/exonuclease/phosphatase family metal-dependent hydrolase